METVEGERRRSSCCAAAGSRREAVVAAGPEAASSLSHAARSSPGLALRQRRPASSPSLPAAKKMSSVSGADGSRRRLLLPTPALFEAGASSCSLSSVDQDRLPFSSLPRHGPGAVPRSSSGDGPRGGAAARGGATAACRGRRQRAGQGGGGATARGSWKLDRDLAEEKASPKFGGGSGEPGIYRMM
ncbi:unnamed protein product [Urochloa humidicola]